MTVEITTRSDITLNVVERVAWSGETVRLSATALAKMRAARERFMTLLAEPEIVIYGVTSGYGQHAGVRLEPEARLKHARNPPTAAAASWGEPFPERVVRAIILARLANFVDGYAAISPAVAEAVCAMLGEPELPSVPSRGQGGAGEVLALSHLFHGLATRSAVAEKDVLCLINGSPVASALVADAAIAARRRIDIAADVLALAAEGFNTPRSHYVAELEQMWNNAHDAWALRRLRERMGGDGDSGRRPYQAPVSFRILPRMLGLAHRAITLAVEVAEESLSSVSDNPVVLPASATYPNGRAVSTGGYHNPHAVAAMDALTAAYANLCLIAGRMGAKMLDSSVSHLPHQLQSGDGLSYLGCLPMAITGYEEEARLQAQSTLLPGSESGGFGQNDVASPAPLAWSKQERAGLMLDCSLAALAPIAVRAFELTNREVPPLLIDLAKTVARLVPDEGPSTRWGPLTENLTGHLRERIFAPHPVSMTE
jgi:histidine ammonia-lyase